MSGWQALFREGSRHGGAVTSGMAVRNGVPSSTFHRRVVEEAWDLLYRRTWAVPGTVPDRTTWLHAALLTVGGTSVALGHETAAGLYGLDRWTASQRTVHVLVPESRHVRGQRWLQVHRSRTLRPTDITVVDGMARTTAARTIIDIAGSKTLSQLEGMLLHARQRGLVDLDDVALQLERRTNAAGRGRVREALANVRGTPADSILEAKAHRLLVSHGYQPVLQHPVRCSGGVLLHLDLAFPEARFGIECDGRAHHDDPTAFERDRERWRALEAAGWAMTWVTWRSLHDEPHVLLDAVARHVTAA